MTQMPVFDANPGSVSRLLCDGKLDGVDLHALAQRVSTPTYIYSANAIRHRIKALQDALHGLDAGIFF
ncbi:MAG: hypothetical protein ABJB04_06035, partial [Betaproteobacteria bacterium]